MRTKTSIIFSIVAFICTIGMDKTYAQDRSDDFKEKRITIQLKKSPLYSVFAELMYAYDIPIGFEESSLDKGHDDYYFQTLVPSKDKKNDLPIEPHTDGVSLRTKTHFITLDFKDARLQDVLDEIVKQMQYYDWTITDDVVNIFPIKGRDPKCEKLLNIRVREFRVSKDKDFGMIQETLVLVLPEFRAFLAQNNLHAESDRYVPSYGNLPLPMELRFSDLTFKELLNGITKLKRGGWILRTGDKNKKKENKGKEVIEVLI